VTMIWLSSASNFLSASSIWICIACLVRSKKVPHVASFFRIVAFCLSPAVAALFAAGVGTTGVGVGAAWSVSFAPAIQFFRWRER
jgi:hypothetical protein